MTGVSDFTAELNVVADETLGTAEDAVSPPAADAESSADMGSTRAEADDSGEESSSRQDPNSIPVITEDQIDSAQTDSVQADAAQASPAQTDSAGTDADSAEAAPGDQAIASVPRSVPGIEHGDEDLPVTSVMSTVPWDEDEESASNVPSADEDFFGGLHEDPRTAAMQIIDEADADNEDDTVYETRSAAERLEEILLDGKRVLDRREAAKLGGISTVSARKMWRALGMSQTDEADKAYTVSDAHALRM